MAVHTPTMQARPRCAECGGRLTKEEHRYLDCHCNWCEGWLSAWAYDHLPKPGMLWMRKFINRFKRALLLTD